MLFQSLSIISEFPEFDENEAFYLDATVTGYELANALLKKGFLLTQSADFMLRYSPAIYYPEQTEFSRCRVVTPDELLKPGQFDFDEGYDLLELMSAAEQAGYRTLPPIMSACFPWERFPHERGVPSLLHIGIQPVPDGSGGLQVLSFSRHKDGSDWIVAFRWHQNIARMLSGKTPWLFGC